MKDGVIITPKQGGHSHDWEWRIKDGQKIGIRGPAYDFNILNQHLPYILGLVFIMLLIPAFA